MSSTTIRNVTCVQAAVVAAAAVSATQPGSALQMWGKEPSRERWLELPWGLVSRLPRAAWEGLEALGTVAATTAGGAAVGAVAAGVESGACADAASQAGDAIGGFFGGE